MTIKPIRSDDDLHAAFKQLEQVFQALAESPQADEMEVLNRKRRLSLQMVKKLHTGLHIPYESLMAAL